MKKKDSGVNDIELRKELWLEQETPLFEPLKNLPVGFTEAQCIWFKDELLICGGYNNGNCYSYHTLKRQYRFICNYPQHLLSSPFFGHKVVQCHYNNIDSNNNNNDNNNNKGIILLSFGGQPRNKKKYTVIMHYQSVWEEEQEQEQEQKQKQEQEKEKEKEKKKEKDKEKKKYKNEKNKEKDSKKISKQFNSTIISKNYNTWLPAKFTIGTDPDDMCDVRALIGGNKNNPLLFTLYSCNIIEIIDLRSLQCIIKDTLPIRSFTGGRCFVRMSNNSHEHLIMFIWDVGLSIKYDIVNNTFQYEKISICSNLLETVGYSFISIENSVIIFGGYKHKQSRLNQINLYSTKTKEWKESPHKMPLSTSGSFAILDQNKKWIHIIGSSDITQVTGHFRIKVRDLIGFTMEDIKSIVEYWVRNRRITFGWIIEFDIIIANYVLS